VTVAARRASGTRIPPASHPRVRRAAAVALLLSLVAAGSLALSGCAPMIVAGMGSAVLMAADRRSSGAQLDDQTIELKVSAAATEKFPDAHLNVNSYNGIVLLTGEAPTAEVRGGITQIAEKTDRVRSVENEMVVGPNSDFGDRSNDTFITSKVKARLVEADKVPANLIKVVTERGVVYLRGLVTPQEGDAAASVAATTEGVLRVVKVFEYTNSPS
jgi:osmotically-inducible protein OsmY